MTFTVDIGGPFKVLSRPYWLKAANRKEPLCGEQVVPVAVITGMGETQIPVEAIADGQGLSRRDADRLLEHDVDPNHMRITPENTKVDYVEFDLGKEVALDLMQVWNYNETDKTQWGLKRVDLAVWTDGAGWRRVKEAVALDEAEGTEDYDEPTLVRLDGVQASKVRLENLVGFVGSNRMGLSEVQFFQVRPAKAVKPSPNSGGLVSSPTATGLTWTPGVDAVQQRIYMGADGNDLGLLGEVKGDVTDVRLSALTGDSSYVWRVDAVRSDGSMMTGDLWSFKTTGLVGWWKFDETSGDEAADSSGHGLSAKVCGGDPNWQPTAGKSGGAIALDGVDDHVRLPVPVGSGGGALTLALWACPTSRGSWARFVEFGNGPFTDNVQFGRVETSDDLTFIAYGVDRNSTRITAGNAIELDKWQFFAATVDAEGKARIYKDGKVIESGTLSPIREVVRVNNYIGRTNYSWDDYYKGLIDDVRVYSYALSESDVQALYEGRAIDRPVQAAMLPRILSAAEAAQASAEPEPVAAEAETPAGAATPGQVTPRPASAPLILIAVVVLAGILGVALLAGRKKG